MNNHLPENPPGRPQSKTPMGPSFSQNDRLRPDVSPHASSVPGAMSTKPDSLEEAISDAKKMAALNEPKKDDHPIIEKKEPVKEPEKEVKVEKHPPKEIEEHPVVIKEPEVPIYDYPEKLNLTEKTGDAVDRALSHLNKDYLENGEIRRKAWLRPIIPLAVGFGVGVLKPVSGLFENIGHASVINSVLSPAVSLLRRVTGENAFSQFARFANRRESSGLLGRIFNGGESRVLKSLFLREDGDMRQLLRLKDQGADLKNLSIGNKNRINNLIAAGFMAELKAQMIAEYNVNISNKDNEKINRMHEAYGMARELFLAKIPTRGQQEKFLLETLPSLLRGKERSLWLKQTAGLAGVGLIKTTALVTLGHIFTAANIKDFAKGVGDFFSSVGTWASDLVNNVLKPAADALGQTAGDIGRGVGTAFDGLQKAVGDGLSGLATWKDHDLMPGLGQLGQGLVDLKDKGVNAISGIGNPLDSLKNVGNPLDSLKNIGNPLDGLANITPPINDLKNQSEVIYNGIGIDPSHISDQIGRLPPDVLKFVNGGLIPSHPADIAKLGGGVDGSLY